jgi:hypothetical protein
MRLPKSSRERQAQWCRARVSHTTDIVVLGDRSPHCKAEEKGQKLLDVDHEAERGHRLALVKESRFRALVGL